MRWLLVGYQVVFGPVLRSVSEDGPGVFDVEPAVGVVADAVEDVVYHRLVLRTALNLVGEITPGLPHGLFSFDFPFELLAIGVQPLLDQVLRYSRRGGVSIKFCCGWRATNDVKKISVGEIGSESVHLCF
jgi:hypothetical protein